MNEQENIDNIEMICKSCGDARRTVFQKKGFSFKVDDWCKIPFECDEVVEYMWVKVTRLNNKSFNGVIDNIAIEPEIKAKYPYGMEVRNVKLTKIENVMAKDKMEALQNG